LDAFMGKPNLWQEDELLLTLHLYCRTPFGKLHKSNPDVIELAKIIGRTPSAVAMKACNFASLDPALSQKGLEGASKADRALWDSFMQNSTAIAEKAESLYECKIAINQPAEKQNQDIKFPTGETETLRTVKTRRVQAFFRRTVLESYNHRCAISGLAIPELLVASHIIPWADDESRRADPTNGIALNALYDKAFDRKLISFDENFRLVLSERIKKQSKDEMVKEYFLKFEGKELEMPYRFLPDIETMNIHHKMIEQN
jgi:putative restriction endonuclease